MMTNINYRDIRPVRAALEGLLRICRALRREGRG